ncbi:MAG: SRPBCC family protein [Gemmatimonadales bacterium]|nr:SRPBCC family protein [Gemmatimonadales bacterium]
MNWNDRRKRNARRRRALRVAAGALTLVGIVLLLGLLLPKEHVSRGQLLLVGRPPETVWRVLTDLDGMPLWRSDITRLERLPDLDGRQTWREVNRAGVSTVESLLAEAPRRMVIQRRQEGRPVLPSRTVELLATESGTEVRVIERTLVTNPLRRIFLRVGMIEPSVTRFLRDLDGRLNLARRIAAEEER